MVLTQLPLQSLLQKADYTGRIAKWATILGSFNIRYMPRTSIKGQGSCRFGGRVCRASDRRKWREVEHG